jgi:hypothetical protein
VIDAAWMETRPKALGWRGWSLLLPAIVTAIGLASFAVFAVSFTELDTLPQSFRTALVLVGAFSLAIGGEVGTVWSVVEIFRKDTRCLWDWSALVLSVAATIGAFVLAFAALLGVRSTWAATVRNYGPIVQGVLIALDGYGLFAELGLYLRGYDERLSEWERRTLAEAERYERMQAVMSGAYSFAPSDYSAQSVPPSDTGTGALEPVSAQGNGHERHVCEQCGREFGSPQAVSAHMRFCKEEVSE